MGDLEHSIHKASRTQRLDVEQVKGVIRNTRVYRVCMVGMQTNGCPDVSRELGVQCLQSPEKVTRA